MEEIDTGVGDFSLFTLFTFSVLYHVAVFSMQKLIKLRKFSHYIWSSEYEGWEITTDDIGEVIRSQVVRSGLDLNLYVMRSN